MIELAPTLRVFQKIGDNSITLACAYGKEKLSRYNCFITIPVPHMQAWGPPCAYKIALPLEKENAPEGGKR